MLTSLKYHHRLKAAALALALTVPTVVLSAAAISDAETGTRSSTVSDKALTPNTPALPSAPPATPAPPETRSVNLVKAKAEPWPDYIETSGNIMPMQETRIGTEIGGLRVASVLVSVGDMVKKGQVLVHLDTATVETDLDAANAQLAEAEAGLAQAAATLDRANRLAPSGGVSQQELTLYETQKHTAEARVAAAQAQVKRQQLRLKFGTLVAPDDGVISYSSASEGAIVQAGNELFRLIRQGRLEWRAEIKGETLLRLAVGLEATVKSPLGPEVSGRIRRLSPTIDLTTRNGLAYVELPAGTDLKAGLNVTGTIKVGNRKVLVLPESAVQRGERDAKVFKVNREHKVEAFEVKTGRTRDGWVEILSGLDVHTPVIASDVQLLKIGELVKAAGLTPDFEH